MDNLAWIEKMKWPFEYIVIPNLKGSDIRDYCHSVQGVVA